MSDTHGPCPSSVLLANSAQLGPASLTRQELLSALDFEIAQGESLLTRHGITTWGVFATIAALLFTGATEAAGTHDWTNVVLVLLVGNWGLAVLAGPWAKALGWGLPDERDMRPYSFREHTLRRGVDPDTLPYHVIHTTTITGAAAYLCFVGFPLFGVVACSVGVVVLLSLGFAWVLCQVRVPLKVKDSPESSRRGRRGELLERLVTTLVFLVGLRALLSVWLTLDKADMRLGLMLGALTWFLGLSLSLIRPPRATTSLRSLRSQLAFANVGVEAARDEAERILHGSPEEDYVAAKAEEVTAELEEYKRLCESVATKMERLIALADEHKASAAKEVVLKERAPELSSLICSMLSEMTAMPKRMKAATRLRSELHVRVKAARILLNIHPDKLKSILDRVDAFGKATDAARHRIADPAGAFKQAFGYIHEAQKGIALPRRLTFSDAYTALFRD